MGLIDDIGAGPVCLDTCIFIYFIEEHPNFINLVEKIFEDIANGKLLGITSGITLLETLVIPLRAKDTLLANKYHELLLESQGLILMNINQTLLYDAAFLRAEFNLKTPDALQIAAARTKKCTAFITNDRRLPKIPGLRVLQLSDYL